MHWNINFNFYWNTFSIVDFFKIPNDKNKVIGTDITGINLKQLYTQKADCM